MAQQTTSAKQIPRRLLDLTDENITPNTIIVNTQNNPSPRLSYLLSRLTHHLHDFVRETRLTTDEWLTAIDFLTETGQTCTDLRQEFILLSDVLGVSTLVEGINHPKPEGATEGTILGPFHTHDAREFENGISISSDKSIHGVGAEKMIFMGEVFDAHTGKPISGAKICTWQADAVGKYDTQYEDRSDPDNRGIFYSDGKGKFWYECIKPVSYPIPNDGPVGKFLHVAGRHCYRPAHVHFIIEKEGYDKLVTALYLKGDDYEKTDAVFGVKSSLILEVKKEEVGGELLWVMRYRFGMVDEERAKEYKMNGLELLDKIALKGEKIKILDGLPVMDLD